MKSIDIKIEQALESVENIEQANAPDFFETRLRAKMEKRFLVEKTNWMRIQKPVWIMASLIALLLMNVYLLSSERKIGGAKRNSVEPANIEGFAKDYQLNENTSQY